MEVIFFSKHDGFKHMGRLSDDHRTLVVTEWVIEEVVGHTIVIILPDGTLEKRAAGVAVCYDGGPLVDMILEDLPGDQVVIPSQQPLYEDVVLY